MHTRQDAPNVKCNSIEDSTARNLIIVAVASLGRNPVAGLGRNPGTKQKIIEPSSIKRRLSSRKPISEDCSQGMNIHQLLSNSQGMNIRQLLSLLSSCLTYIGTDMSNLHKEKIELSQQYTDLIERRQFLKTKVEEKMKEYQRAWTDPNANPKMGRVWSEEVYEMYREADSLKEKIKQKEQEWLAMEIKINKRVKDHHRDLERVSKEISKLDHLHPSLKKEIGSLKEELVKKYNEYWKYKKLRCEALRDIEKLKIGEGEQEIVRFQLKNNSTIRGPKRPTQQPSNPPQPPSLRNPTARVLKEATQSQNKIKKTTSTSPEKPKGPCDLCSNRRFKTNRGCGGTFCDFTLFS